MNTESRRLAYLGMAGIITIIILTGLIKTYKNVHAPDLSRTLILWSTRLHNIFFVLFILTFAGHISAIILKPNRPMVRGIFTGAVRLDYTRHRHPLWLSGPDTRTSQPPVKAVDTSALVETVAVMVDNPPAGASGKSSEYQDADAAGMAKMNEMEEQQGTPHQLYLPLFHDVTHSCST